MSKPCAPCAKARKFVPAPVRKKLEELEQRMLDRKSGGVEEAPAAFTASTLPLTGKDRI